MPLEALGGDGGASQNTCPQAQRGDGIPPCNTLALEYPHSRLKTGQRTKCLHHQFEPCRLL